MFNNENVILYYTFPQTAIFIDLQCNELEAHPEQVFGGILVKIARL